MIAQALALLASSDGSCHMSACGGEVIVVGGALLGFCAAGSLSWPASLGAAHLVVSAMRAVRNAIDHVLMAIVIVKVGAAWGGACKKAARVF